MEEIPFWVWLVVSGIVFSAYMTIRTNREERELELWEAEQEGERYMERIRREREKKNNSPRDPTPGEKMVIKKRPDSNPAVFVQIGCNIIFPFYHH